MARINTKSPWEPKRGEPLEHWQWFIVYLHQQKRSLKRVALQVGKSQNWIERLSIKWQWKERRQAWDADIGRKVSRALDALHDEAIEAMRQRHIQIGLGMQSAAAKELKAWIAKIEKAAEEAKEAAIREGRDPSKAHHDPVLSVNELIRLANEGMTVERLNRGEPTDVQKIVTNDGMEEKLDALTVEDLREFKRLRAKIDGTAE